MERPRKGPLLFFSRGRAPTRRRRGLGRFYSFGNVKSSACASRGWGLLAGAGCDLLQGWGGLSPYPAKHTGPGRLGQGVETPLGRGGLDSGARPPPPQRRRKGDRPRCPGPAARIPRRGALAPSQRQQVRTRPAWEFYQAAVPFATRAGESGGGTDEPAWRPAASAPPVGGRVLASVLSTSGDAGQASPPRLRGGDADALQGSPRPPLARRRRCWGL